VLERGLLRMDPERHTCTWKNEPVTLTVTEFLILQALASRPGVVKSRNALMDAAYDDQVYVDDRTLTQEVQGNRRRFRHDRNALWRRLSVQGNVTLVSRFRSSHDSLLQGLGDFGIGTPAGFVSRVVLGFEVPMRSSLQGHFKSTTRMGAWRPGSTA
jgi:hypothetical protein